MSGKRSIERLRQCTIAASPFGAQWLSPPECCSQIGSSSSSGTTTGLLQTIPSAVRADMPEPVQRLIRVNQKANSVDGLTR